MNAAEFTCLTLPSRHLQLRIAMVPCWEIGLLRLASRAGDGIF